MSDDGDVTIAVTVSARTAAYLRALTRSSSVPDGTLEDVVSYLVHSAADGLRRPGAWERGWLTQAFGDFPDGPHTPGVPYSHLEPWSPVRVTEIDADAVSGTCKHCGDLVTYVLVTGGDFGSAWECLGCVAQWNEDRPPPEDLAVAALLAFCARAFDHREDRPRCSWCGCGLGARGDTCSPDAPGAYCAKCAAEIGPREVCANCNCTRDEHGEPGLLNGCPRFVEP